MIPAAAVPPPDDVASLSPEDIRRTLHELRVHQLELERQNEELRRTQVELDASRARYFDFYNLAPVGDVTLSEHGLILQANLTVASLLGVTQTDLVKQPLSRFVSKDDSDIDDLHRKQLFESGEPQAYDVRMVKEDGTVFWTHIAAVVSPDADGEPVCRMTLTDITERKRADEAIRRRGRLFEQVQQLGNIGYFEHDVRENRVEWSDQMYRIFHADPAGGPLTYEQVVARVHPDDRAYHAQAGRRTATEGSVTFEHRLVWPDGSVHTVWGRTEIERAEDGQPRRIVGMAQDITERKKAEGALKASEERLGLAARSAHLGVWDWDLVTNEMVWDDRMMEMYGVTPGGFPGSIQAWETSLHSDDHDRAIAECQAAIRGERPYDTQFRVCNADGTVRHIKSDALIVRAPDGKPLRMIGINRDITAEVEASAERDRFQSQLNQSQKMESVGRLAGGVAHDFNNMLGVILGHTEMALEEVDPAQPLHADLEEIRSAANRSADLARQLLAFARKQTIAPRVLDLNDTVERMLTLLRRLIGEDIRLAWLPGEDVWPIMMDPSQFDQILANLCVNARDAIAGVGKLTIETANATFDEAYCADHAGFVPGEYVRLVVSDTGCGMDSDTLSHIFEPFFTTKALGQGTGLGLATVYGIVKQNQGFINTYSEPEHGTTFTISLPRYVGKTEPTRTDVSLEPVTPGHETILLVEDESAILSLTVRMLERQGYTVLAAHTPGEAIRLAREYVGEIHLLMTDVIMPEMNGRDLARNLLSLYPHLGRLFMSGYTSNVIAHHGVLDDGVCFIQKPFSTRDLSAKVREALDRE